MGYCYLICKCYSIERFFVYLSLTELNLMLRLILHFANQILSVNNLLKWNDKCDESRVFLN